MVYVGDDAEISYVPLPFRHEQSSRKAFITVYHTKKARGLQRNL
jgi:hypothetical protein